jgi:hypothetical protein
MNYHKTPLLNSLIYNCATLRFGDSLRSTGPNREDCQQRHPLRACCWRVKGASCVAKHHLLPLEQDKHIGVLLVVPTIHKLQRHRNETGIGPIEMRPQINLRARCVPSWKVDDLNLPFEIESNKMASTASQK